MQTKKRDAKEFYRDAVSLVLQQGYSRAEAARNLGLAANWRHPRRRLPLS
jgi:transposase